MLGSWSRHMARNLYLIQWCGQMTSVLSSETHTDKEDSGTGVNHRSGGSNTGRMAIWRLQLRRHEWSAEKTLWQQDQSSTALVFSQKGLQVLKRAISGTQEIFFKWVWGDLEKRKARGKKILWRDGTIGLLEIIHYTQLLKRNPNKLPQEHIILHSGGWTKWSLTGCFHLSSLWKHTAPK